MAMGKQMWFEPATEKAGARVLVIAELGVNHDGEVGKALSMVTAAQAAGAGAVKMQLFAPETLLSNQARLAKYQVEAGAEDPFTMLKRLALTVEQMRKVRDAAGEVGVKFIVTPFSLEDVEGVGKMEVDGVKIASPDAVNVPLLKEAAGLGKPMIISTGTCEMEELEFAVELLKGHKAGGCLLHCVSSYPTAVEDAALGGVVALRKRFGVAVGYSDHTTELVTGAVAVGAGACVLEKHLTLDRQGVGPDHGASLDPVGMTHYVDLVLQAQAMMGRLEKRVLECERDVRDVSRQSVCAKRDLAVGRVLGKGDVTVRRPGTGIAAKDYEKTVGKRMKRAVKQGDLIMVEDVE